MIHKPLISVITINFNDKHGLDRTFKSVFNQTYTDFEYIVIDGGSTDGSKELIEQNKDKIDFWLSEPDTGVYNAMNKGIKNANGNYLLFINSGDELFNDNVLIENYQAIHTEDLIYGNLLKVSKDAKKVHHFPDKLNYTTFITGTIGHPTTFIKKSLFDDIGLYDEELKIVSDWKFFSLAIIKHNCSYRKIEVTLAKFYMDGISTINPDQTNRERALVIKQYFNNYKRLYQLKLFVKKAKKSIISRLIRMKLWVSYSTNTLIRKQLKNPNSIPIIIISFNQLFYLKQLIDFLLKRDFSNIVIIDNNSDYEPLLHYFKEIGDNRNITLHRLKENYGHLAFWKNDELFKQYSDGFYVVTDADVIPFENTPYDFMIKFRKILNKDLEVTKVGFSLSLDDIPEHNPNKEQIIKWEKQYWIDKRQDFFIAPIDTTFALYRPHYNRAKVDFYKGIRTDKPYIANHGGWYINSTDLTEEQKHYIATANNSSSWLMNENGELTNEQFKEHYKA